MYLKTIGLKNFRSFESGEIELQKDLTVFVGENNGGKSNAIDAIRLVTSPLSGRREIYCEPTDVCFQSTDSHFELEARYAELTAGQQGRFISATTDTSLTEARFGLRFDGSKYASRPTLWAGKDGNDPEPGCHDMVRHLYLPPLRDAKRSLASSNPTRIMALLSHFMEGTTPAELAKELARTQSHDVLTKVSNAVDKGLQALTSGVRRQGAALGFSADEDLVDIARDLRFRLADHGVIPEDLRYSGHGYANLLFMATIAVELERVRTADLTIFLVEEPEAHLHPQLQAAVLAFLRDQADQSRKQASRDHGPAGELQVIVATHSPNLSAWVTSDRLVVFKSTTSPSTTLAQTPTSPPSSTAGQGAAHKATNAPASATDVPRDASHIANTNAAGPRRSTRCIALSSMPLDPIDRRKVDRYLDVTKAALLFGGRVLLVEGIAEALLLPVIAKKYVLKQHPDKLRLFRSTVFVPIDGVDFEPYVSLLLTPVSGVRVADRLIVVTDGDKATSAGEDSSAEVQPAVETEPAATDSPNSKQKSALPGELRRGRLRSLARTIGSEECLQVFVNTYSLEAELIEAGNDGLMRKAYLTLHPSSTEKWDAAMTAEGDERARRVSDIFRSTRKGDFAQTLSHLIEQDETFEVPSYISRAIAAVVAP